MDYKLKAEDLMIGNILDFNGMECVVKEIDNQGVVVWIEETKEEEWIDLFQFSPLPITEDWLFKLGFIVNENYEHPGFDGYILKDDKWFGIGDFNGHCWIIEFLDQSIGSPKINYVHQLQNIIKSLKY